MKNAQNDSRHYKHILEKVIRPACKIVFEECDQEFQERCHVERKPIEKWEEELEKEYRIFRQDLKIICYGEGANEGVLDARKMAAIFCKSIIKEKAFRYNVSEAQKMVEEKKKSMSSVKFNLWAVDTVYMNYKLAYYVSLQLVYLTTLYELEEKGETQKLLELNKIGHMIRYPLIKSSATEEVDSFDVNVIIGMARSDISMQNFDMFLFAMLLYQIEMYTFERLKSID